MAADYLDYDLDGSTHLDRELIQQQLSTTNRRFERACAHVRFLQRSIDDLKKLYRRSVDDGNRAAQYKYKIKLSVTMGIKCYFYDYACEKAQEVAEMRYKLGLLEPVTDDDDDDDNDNVSNDDDDDDSDGNDFEVLYQSGEDDDEDAENMADAEDAGLSSPNGDGGDAGLDGGKSK